MSDQDFLQTMAQASAERVRAARAKLSENALLRQAMATAPPPPLVRSAAGFDVIAELKLRSPAVGQLRAAGSEDPAQRALIYAQAGAAAVSILTEPSRFDGSIAHLSAAGAALRAMRVPAMRKDFLVDPYQVVEARAAGRRRRAHHPAHALASRSWMSCVRRPGPAACSRCSRPSTRPTSSWRTRFWWPRRQERAAHRPGRSANSAGIAPVQWLVGVNCRDLTTLQVVPGRLEALVRLLPDARCRAWPKAASPRPRMRGVSPPRATTWRWSAARS